MSTKIQLKRSRTSDNSPELDAGEPFYNLTDKKLFVGHDGTNLDKRKHIAEIENTSVSGTDTIRFTVGESADNVFEQKVDNVEHASSLTWGEYTPE